MTKHFLHQETNKQNQDAEKQVGKSFFLSLILLFKWMAHFSNLLFQSTKTTHQKYSIALVFHIEMHLLGLQVFLKVLIQVAFIVKSSLFLREGSAGFPFFKKNNSIT